MRRTPMRQRYRNTGPGPADVQALRGRSGGRCEMGLHGCLGQATEVAHRIKRGMGGRRGEARLRNNALSNLLHACHECHAWCHARPEEAYDLGLMLREWQDPTVEPAALRHGWTYLADDGTWSTDPPEAS